MHSTTTFVTLLLVLAVSCINATTECDLLPDAGYRNDILRDAVDNGLVCANDLPEDVDSFCKLVTGAVYNLTDTPTDHSNCSAVTPRVNNQAFDYAFSEFVYSKCFFMYQPDDNATRESFCIEPETDNYYTKFFSREFVIVQQIEVVDKLLLATVAQYRDREEIYILFRGSIADSNHRTNFDVEMIEYPHGDGYVSRGPSAAWDLLRDEVIGMVTFIRHLFPTFRVVVAGHSLGGSLAMLAIADQDLIAAADGNIGMIAYGSPRVGDRLFADYVNNLDVEFVYRVTVAGDPVVTAPFDYLDFHHIGTEVFFPSPFDSAHLECDLEDFACAKDANVTTRYDLSLTYLGDANLGTHVAYHWLYIGDILDPSTTSNCSAF